MNSLYALLHLVSCEHRYKKESTRSNLVSNNYWIFEEIPLLTVVFNITFYLYVQV